MEVPPEIQEKVTPAPEHVQLSDEDAVKLQTVQKDVARVELALGASLL